MIKSLGRIAIKDEGDKNFLIKKALPKKASKRISRYWNGNGWWGDQGDTPHCVGFSWAHWIEDGPVTHKGKAPIVDPKDIYTNAQKLDQWAGEDYYGTSVRAGAKYLQSIGFISEYLWAWDVDTLARAVLEVSPVVVGTDWYYSMFKPDKDNIIHIENGIIGGHAYVIDGVNMKTKMLRIKNSWGRSWGKDGYAYISFADMDKLIKNDGEACLATELKPEEKSK